MILQAVRILLTLREWFVHASSQCVLLLMTIKKALFKIEVYDFVKSNSFLFVLRSSDRKKGLFSNPPKVIQQFFWGYSGTHFGLTDANHAKIYQ